MMYIIDIVIGLINFISKFVEEKKIGNSVIDYRDSIASRKT